LVAHLPGEFDLRESTSFFFGEQRTKHVKDRPPGGVPAWLAAEIPVVSLESAARSLW